MFLYDNITISGGVAVGATTLMENLKAYLEPYGWKFTSTGKIIREYTKENVLPSATLVSDDFDRRIETRVAETLKNEAHWVVEGWLSGFVAREYPRVLRVLLHCSEEAVRVDRVMNRDKLPASEAKHFIRLREEKNIKKWKRIYGNYDFFSKKYYHVVIDTYSSGPFETVGKVLDVLGYKNIPTPQETT